MTCNPSTPNVPWAANLDAAIAALRSPHLDELAKLGLSVRGTFEEVDDPVLIDADGQPIETWREGLPYQDRLSAEEYEQTKRLLQIELLKAQTWMTETGERLVVGFDGRDAAGKGGTIKRFVEHLNPDTCELLRCPRRVIESRVSGSSSAT